MAIPGDLLEDPPRRDQSARTGHGAVHHDDTRLELRRQPDRLLAVARLADDDDQRIVLEEAPEAAPYQAVIVGEQNSDVSDLDSHRTVR